MANNIERILLALDFDEQSVFPMEKARHLAKQVDAELTVLHVIEDLRDYPFLHLSASDTAVMSCSRQMDDYAEILNKMGVTVKHTSVREGKPVDSILDTADTMQVDLILLGARRKKLLERMLGTTAERVIKNANQPVWVVHPEDATQPVQTIVCATDFTPGSAETLKTALQLTRTLHAKLEILHVFGHETVTGDECSLDDMEQHLDRTASDRNVVPESGSMEAYLRDFDLSGVDYSYIIRHGAVSDEISNVVKITDCDLLVMGVITTSRIIRFLGRGTLDKLLRRLPCSIVTVRHGRKGED